MTRTEELMLQLASCRTPSEPPEVAALFWAHATANKLAPEVCHLFIETDRAIRRLLLTTANGPANWSLR